MTQRMQQQERPAEAAQQGFADVVVSDEIADMMARMEARKGDPSKMTDAERTDYVRSICRALRLNPLTRPVQFLSLQGKEVAYLTKAATDQLAWNHCLDRETIEGPEVRVIEGVKVAYCKVRVKLPNGRSETATATFLWTKPADDLMKVETKAKRRGTLSILGVGMLDESEAESIEGGTKVPDRSAPPAGVAPVETPRGSLVPALGSLGIEPDRSRDVAVPVTPPAPAAPAPVAEEPALTIAESETIAAFHQRVAEIDLPGEAVAVWMKHRTELASLPALTREAAWRALCKRTEEVGKMKNAKVWLKKAIAEEDARRVTGHDGGPLDDPPAGGGAPGGSGAANASGTSSATSSGAGARAQLAAVPEWMGDEARERDYLASKTHTLALENAVRAHGRYHARFRSLAAERLVALSPADDLGTRPTHLTCVRTVERWSVEGPRPKASTARKAVA